MWTRTRFPPSTAVRAHTRPLTGVHGGRRVGLPRKGGLRNANAWLRALYGRPSVGPSDLVLGRLVGGTQHDRPDPPQRLLSLEVKLGVRQQGLVSIREFGELLAGIWCQNLGPFY